MYFYNFSRECISPTWKNPAGQPHSPGHHLHAGGLEKSPTRLPGQYEHSSCSQITLRVVWRERESQCQPSQRLFCSCSDFPIFQGMRSLTHYLGAEREHVWTSHLVGVDVKYPSALLRLPWWSSCSGRRWEVITATIDLVLYFFTKAI